MNVHGFPDQKEDIRMTRSVLSKTPKKGYGGKIDVWIGERLVATGLKDTEAHAVKRAFETYFNIED